MHLFAHIKYPENLFSYLYFFFEKGKKWLEEFDVREREREA